MRGSALNQSRSRQTFIKQIVSKWLRLNDIQGIITNWVLCVQDTDNPDNFYVHKTADPKGFLLRFKTANYGASFNCAKLAGIILDATPYKTVSYLLGNVQDIDGMAYHLILTSKPLAEML